MQVGSKSLRMKTRNTSNFSLRKSSFPKSEQSDTTVRDKHNTIRGQKGRKYRGMEKSERILTISGVKITWVSC
jgi:hypothetical protein